MFKINISDPEEGKAWQAEKEATPLIGTKIGEEFNGSLIGLEGYTLKVTGGSDREGFPMRRGLEGTGRRKTLMRGGAGYNPELRGDRRRKSVRGNVISEDIVQINTVVSEREEGAEPIPDLLGFEGEEEESSEEKSEETQDSEEDKKKQEDSEETEDSGDETEEESEGKEDKFEKEE